MRAAGESWTMRNAFAATRGLMLAVIVATLVCSCADSAGPSEAEAREVFEDRVRKGLSDGTIRLKSFQKTSGPLKVLPQGVTHVVAFRADIECLKDYRGLYCGGGCKQGTILHVEEGSGRRNISYDGVASSPGGSRLSSYEEENQWAGLQFDKTWRGWAANNGKLY